VTTKFVKHSLKEGCEMFQTILLAVDGSEHSTKAAMLAGKLAQEFRGEVIAYHLRERIPTRAGAILSHVDEEANIADDIANRLKADGVSVRPEQTRPFTVKRLNGSWGWQKRSMPMSS
jgi:nucleotide-binding universal stress UspA family protein